MQMRKSFIRWLAAGLLLANVLASIALPYYAWAAEPEQPQQAALAKEAASKPDALAIALVVGVACLGAAYAVSHVGSAACGTISERPEMFGRTLIFVGLAEGIAIYGLIIGIMLMRA